MNASVDSVFPEKYRILSGSALKMIAVITMLIDHIGAVLLSMYQPAQKILFTLFGREYTVYLIFRDIGRAAFPIFCFLLLEGFRHTRSRFLYGRNLLLFALLSEIPWNLMFTNTLRYERQNVFFTLFLGYLAFCAIEYFQTRPSMQLLCILGLLVVSIFLKADYGWRGYIFLLIMYYMRDDKPGQAILGSCWLYYEWRASFAFLSINLYNGKRGFIRGKSAKYFFYWFYPVHIIGLVILRQLCFYLNPARSRSVHPSTTNTVASSTPSKKSCTLSKVQPKCVSRRICFLFFLYDLFCIFINGICRNTSTYR